MGPAHDSDPLVSPRGDEPERDPAAAGDEPREPSRAQPGGESLAEPVQPEPRTPAPRTPATGSGTGRRGQSPNMLPAGRVRSAVERRFVRVIATGGIVGVGVVIAAIMASSNSQGWLIGLVVSVVSVVLAAVLWSSRVL
jgi:hypothetical protein